FPDFADFMERSEQAGYSLGYLIRLHPELKKRFVESTRFAKRFKSVPSLTKGANAAMSPFINLLINWEKSRGTSPVTRLTELHYKCSIRYHFFLGYNRYCKDQGWVGTALATSIQPSLAKEYQMKAKGEL